MSSVSSFYSVYNMYSVYGMFNVRVRQEEMPSLVVLSIGKGSNRKVNKVLPGIIVFWSTPARSRVLMWRRDDMCPLSSIL